MGPTTFNNHKAIVGGNDTACDSKQTMRAMCRIDREEQAGYLITAGQPLRHKLGDGVWST